MNERLKVAIVGSGNIGTDLMYKVLHSPKLELGMVAGIVPESEGLKCATSLGIPTTAEGIGPVLEQDDIRLVFDATGAKPHLRHAPLLKEAGKIAIDLTPAAVAGLLTWCQRSTWGSTLTVPTSIWLLAAGRPPSPS